MDPDHLPETHPSKMGSGASVSGAGGAKARRDIWGYGHGIGAVQAVAPAAALIDRLTREYCSALARLAG